MKLSQEQFCKMHSGYYGEVIDNVNQIAHHAFTSGEELRDYVESMINQYLSNQPAPVSVVKKTADEILYDMGLFPDEHKYFFSCGAVLYNDVVKAMELHAEQFRSAPSIPSREEAERELMVILSENFAPGKYSVESTAKSIYDWLLSQIGQPGDGWIKIKDEKYYPTEHCRYRIANENGVFVIFLQTGIR